MSGGPASVVRVFATPDQLLQIAAIAGVSSDDHGQLPLDDGRFAVTLYADTPELIDQIRAVGVEVAFVITPEQVLARNARIAQSEGDSSSAATGDVLLAFTPPVSDPVPDDFTLTLQPSVGSPTVFATADLTDSGDGLLSVTVAAPAAGVRYSAQAHSTTASIDVTVFEGFELQQVVAAAATPGLTLQVPPVADPFVFATDEEDPDADSQPAEPEDLDQFDPAKLAKFQQDAGRPGPDTPNA